VKRGTLGVRRKCITREREALRTEEDDHGCPAFERTREKNFSDRDKSSKARKKHPERGKRILRQTLGGISKNKSLPTPTTTK